MTGITDMPDSLIFSVKFDVKVPSPDEKVQENGRKNIPCSVKEKNDFFTQEGLKGKDSLRIFFCDRQVFDSPGAQESPRKPSLFPCPQKGWVKRPNRAGLLHTA